MRTTRGVMAGARRASMRAKLSGLCGAAAIAIGLMGWTSPASAAVVAYSMQHLNGYTLTGGTLGVFSPNTSTSSAQLAVPTGSEAHSGLADALQSYVGPIAGRPAENTFTKKGFTTPDYSRGDSQIDMVLNLTVVPSTNDVAELYLNSLGNSSGSGAWSLSAPLTLTSIGAVTLGFNFANELQLFNDGTGTAQGKYSFNVSIQTPTGTVVFDESPSSVNRSLSLPSAGSIDSISSGTVVLTSNTLSAGSYFITVSGNESAFGSVSQIPEPATLSVIGIGCLGLLARRRRA